MASAVTYLLSPAASYINGVTLAVDGGSSLCKGFPEGYELTFDEESKVPAYVGYPESNRVDAPEEFTNLLERYRKPKSKL